jgi:hypothetical protein
MAIRLTVTAVIAADGGFDEAWAAILVAGGQKEFAKTGMRTPWRVRARFLGRHRGTAEMALNRVLYQRTQLVVGHSRKST